MTISRTFTCTLMLVGFALLCTGCETTHKKKTSINELGTNLGERILTLEDNIRANQGSIESLNTNMQQLETSYRNEMRYLDNKVERTQQKLKAQDENAKRQLEQQQQAFEKKLRIVVDELNKENVSLRKKIKKVSSSRQTSAQDYAGGNVHVVQSGETLTGIAKLYGVSVTEMCEANDLDDPNAIRLGQKMLIPET